MPGPAYEYWNSGRIVALRLRFWGRISSLRRLQQLKVRLAKTTATFPDAISMVTPASERAKGVPRRCGFLALIYLSRNVGGDNQGNGFENTVTCSLL
jgi:hypothetical protein